MLPPLLPEVIMLPETSSVYAFGSASCLLFITQLNFPNFLICSWLFVVIQVLPKLVLLLKHIVFSITPDSGGLSVCSQKPGGDLGQGQIQLFTFQGFSPRDSTVSLTQKALAIAHKHDPFHLLRSSCLLLILQLTTPAFSLGNYYSYPILSIF